jgi:hypothetical protein
MNPVDHELYHRLWPEENTLDTDDVDEVGDIESSIATELSQLKGNKKKKPFYSIKMSQECGTQIHDLD